MISCRLYFLCAKDGPVRYVGKTTAPLARRLWQHVSEAKSGTVNHRRNWIRSVGLEIEIHQIDCVRGDGCIEERATIQGLRAIGVQLVNGTDGGDGKVGYRTPEATRLQIAASRRGKALGPFSERHRAAISAAQTGAKNHRFGTTTSEDTKKKLAKSMLGRKLGPATAETKAKISAANRGRSKPPELVARIEKIKRANFFFRRLVQTQAAIHGGAQ